MKRCSHCEELKDESEFYPLKHTTDGLNSWCKACQREASAASKHRVGKTSEPSTLLVMQELALRGIPSSPGYGFGLSHVDLLAWGCVHIEAKTSKPANRKDGQFVWHYSLAQKEKWFEGLIIFIGDYHDLRKRIFVIPAYHELLRYKRDGNMRDAVYVNLTDRTHHKNTDWELQELFLHYENAFDEIETERLRISNMLRENTRQGIEQVNR